MGIRVRLRCVAAIGAAASVGAFLLPVAMVRADGQNVATAAPAGTAGNEPPDSRAPDPRASDSRSIAEAALATLEREAARLRNAGDGATADAMEKQVRLFRDRLSGKGRAEGDGPELHVVGVYEGPAAGGVRRGFREHPVGAASVEVG